MISLGDAFWWRPRGSGQPSHLYFVITRPRGPDQEVLLVNMSTKRKGSDLSCILKPGDHPEIEHESIIEYGKALTTRIRDLERMLSQFPDLCSRAEKASPELIRKIQEGGLRSPHLAEEYKRWIEKELTGSIS
jgi:hypothetical protein